MPQTLFQLEQTITIDWCFYFNSGHAAYGDAIALTEGEKAVKGEKSEMLRNWKLAYIIVGYQTH